MKECAYGAYNDLVLHVMTQLKAELLLDEKKLEKIILENAMFAWAQHFFIMRSQAELENHQKINRIALTRNELGKISGDAKISYYIKNAIAAYISPEKTPSVTTHLAAFDTAYEQRSKDYNLHWHEFYLMQKEEAKKILESVAAGFFHVESGEDVNALIMKRVWHNHVRPAVESKMIVLREKNEMTSDNKISMAECLSKHMQFIDLLVMKAQTLMSKTNQTIFT